MSTPEGAVPPVAASSDEQRIAAALGHRKRKLLGLSKRNRALNFRMTKVSTVAIVDEQPAEVFRRLYLQPARPAPASACGSDPDGGRELANASRRG